MEAGPLALVALFLLGMALLLPAGGFLLGMALLLAAGALTGGFLLGMALGIALVLTTPTHPIRRPNPRKSPVRTWRAPRPFFPQSRTS
jgi:hypothetical protein